MYGQLVCQLSSANHASYHIALHVQYKFNIDIKYKKYVPYTNAPTLSAQCTRVNS